MDNLCQDTVCNIRTVLVLSRRLSSAGQSLCLQIFALWLVILSRSCLVPLMELMMILFMKLMGHMLRSLLFFSLVGALLMIFRTCVSALMSSSPLLSSGLCCGRDSGVPAGGLAEPADTPELCDAGLGFHWSQWLDTRTFPRLMVWH